MSVADDGDRMLHRLIGETLGLVFALGLLFLLELF